MSLLFLGLHETTICWLNFLEHVQSFLGVTHFHSQIGLGKHNSHLFWCVSKLGNSFGKHLFSHVKLLVLAINHHKIKINTSTLFLTKRQSKLLSNLRVILNRLRISNSWQLESMLQSSDCLHPILANNLNFGFHQHEHWVLTNREILSESLFQEVVSCLHISRLRIN